METCPSCGKELKAEAIEIKGKVVFCRNCGKELTAATNMMNMLDNLTEDDVKQMTLVSGRLESSLDTSLDGLAKALIYCMDVNENTKIYIDIFQKLENILDKNLSLFYGKDKRDNDLKQLLLVYEQFSLAVFNGKSVDLSQVPDGCGAVWFYWVQLFNEADKVKENVSSSLNNQGTSGLQKAKAGLGTMSIKLRKYGEAKDKIFAAMQKSEFGIQKITDRVKEMWKV